MGRFANPQDLLKQAKDYIDRRMSSLENDVNHCIKIEPYAPYPALIYCFSNIDLLGALYAGKARKNANTTQQSKNYMKHFMGYNELQSTLLQCIFRHKLIHLVAEPLLSVIEYKSRRIAWQYNHYNVVNHLIFVPATSTNNNIQVAPVDEIFEISILGLAEDIVKSVYKDGGYLQMLEKDNGLQSHFEEAVEDIHSMIHIKTKPDGTLKC